MLSATFQHIQGVGEKTERRLWGKGCRSWEDLLEHDFCLPAPRYKRVKAGILESMGRLDALDHGYFRESLGTNLSWRAFNAFRDHACFLDIETTGLFESDHTTTVCVHGPGGTKSYVAGINMDELAGDLEKYRLIVSFNGARFDLPFLAKDLGMGFDQIHLDLVYPLRKLGFRGGLKAIERELGISRESDGVTGLDAVRLWHAYRTGRETEVCGKKVEGVDALNLLIGYNRDDTVNLELLAEKVVCTLKERHGF